MVTQVVLPACSIRDLNDIVYSLNQRGIVLGASEHLVDTRSAASKVLLDILGVFAEFETNLRRECRMEGIAAVKALKVYGGRKPSIDSSKVYRLYVYDKMAATAIARQLSIGRASVCCVLDNYEQPA